MELKIHSNGNIGACSEKPQKQDKDNVKNRCSVPEHAHTLLFSLFCTHSYFTHSKHTNKRTKSFSNVTLESKEVDLALGMNNKDQRRVLSASLRTEYNG